MTELSCWNCVSPWPSGENLVSARPGDIRVRARGQITSYSLPAAMFPAANNLVFAHASDGPRKNNIVFAENIVSPKNHVFVEFCVRPSRRLQKPRVEKSDLLWNLVFRPPGKGSKIT